MQYNSILVVDDNKPLCDLLQLYLKPFAPTIYIAKDGATGKEYAEQHHPDVAFVDFFIPGEDGVHCANEILTVSPATKIVLMSANSDIAGYTEDNNKFKGFLQKPFTGSQIREMIMAIDR